jgi:type IV secretion system protein VirB9
MKALLLCASLTLAGFAPTLAHAALDPVASRNDSRVRYITYEPDDVVTIYGKVGTATLIMFDKDEQLIDMAGGDTRAWGAGTPQARNGVFIKPTAAAPETNIHVITTRHEYVFDMRLAGKKQPVYWTVRFRYPAIAAVRAAATVEKERVRTLLDQAAPAQNRRYSVQGSGELAPVEAWDDGASTYLRFAARGTVPAIYATRDGKEVLENFSTERDVVRLSGVGRKFVLRVGRQVACVFNDGYNQNAPRPATNTASPKVQRILKGQP